MPACEQAAWKNELCYGGACPGVQVKPYHHKRRRRTEADERRLHLSRSSGYTRWRGPTTRQLELENREKTLRRCDPERRICWTLSFSGVTERRRLGRFRNANGVRNVFQVSRQLAVPGYVFGFAERFRVGSNSLGVFSFLATLFATFCRVSLYVGGLDQRAGRQPLPLGSSHPRAFTRTVCAFLFPFFSSGCRACSSFATWHSEKAGRRWRARCPAI